MTGVIVELRTAKALIKEALNECVDMNEQLGNNYNSTLQLLHDALDAMTCAIEAVEELRTPRI